MVTDSNDFYEILGVSRDASDKDIKSAYKKAARKYHPDNAETGNEDLFKKVGEAYEALKDPQKRQIYDQYGADGLKGAGGFGGGFDGFAGAGGFEDLGDIFSSFFGGGAGFGGGRRSGPRASRGQDQSVEITLKFLDPKSETKKKIRLNPLVECSTCDGKGAEKESDIVTCSTCNGMGQVTTVQNTILGQIRQTATCPSCKGTGKEIKNPCKSCKGKGLRREESEVEVTIPAGIYDAATMRLAGLGDAGRHGGPPGDIYLYINVEDDKELFRSNPDANENVYSEIDVEFPDAALGCKVKVPTINGEKEIKIDSGTQSGHIHTLKQEGFPKLKNPARFGDHFVKINVVTPKKLSGKEKDLLKQLQKLRNK